MKNNIMITCLIFFIVGILFFNILPNICGCNVTEGQEATSGKAKGTLFTPHDFREHDPDKRSNNNYESLIVTVDGGNP